MPAEISGRRLRVYVREGLRVHGRPVAEQVVRRARDLGLAGATVLRGVAGYGGDHRLHSGHLVELSSDLPLIVEIVDRPDAIARLVEELEDLVPEGLWTVEDVPVMRQRRPHQGDRGG